ncbi:hypothetical protein [Nocardia altamirensis]|uniref:hypothetical protein n=1 Tax=Nocardia altamirensis TaxID=472158 RepID=UPI00084045AC|nr:hypothetical protein [Nocardia altamirensis]
MSTSINGVEVARFFASGGDARRLLDRWKSREGLEFVAEQVLGHVSSTVHTIGSDEIAQLSTTHPLGKIGPEVGYAIALIKNWYPDFAFTHLFHFCLEELGRIFSIDEFREWSSTGAARAWLWEPAQVMLQRAEAQGHSRDAARDAMQWRIGLFYYSFLREIYAVASLRERGLSMLSHPLADALFRVDTWCGNTVVELFISNSEFKSGSRGRKKTPADFLRPGQPQFRFVRLEMEKRHVWGQVHLPSAEEIDRCAQAIRASRLA